MSKKKKVIIITTSSILGVIVLLMATFFIYTGIYYHADTERVDKYCATKNVTYIQINGSTLEIRGKGSKGGVIFYPGAKVEYTAYKPLLSAVAEQGYTCLLIKMPFNLAIFNGDAAEAAKEKYPRIKNWYLMGHSLGGVVASQYLSSNIEEYKGIVFLASYPYADLSKSSLKQLTIRGTNDGVLDLKKYESSKPSWPKNASEYVIEGGNHAYYGMYGEQKGDGEASITNEEQIGLAAKAITNFLVS